MNPTKENDMAGSEDVNKAPLTRHKRYLNKVAHLEREIERLTEELRLERLKNVQRSMTPFDL